MEEFPSKIDAWLLLVLLLSVAVSIAGTFLSVRKGSLLGYLSAFVIIPIGAVLPMWLLLSTKYMVTSDYLIIRSGPRLWTIPIAQISSVQDTRNTLSSPALSLDRLRIDYDNGKAVMVSPKDKTEFRAAIGHPKS